MWTWGDEGHRGFGPRGGSTVRAFGPGFRAAPLLVWETVRCRRVLSYNDKLWGSGSLEGPYVRG